MESPSIRDSSHPRQQIRQAVSRQNHPSVCNPACTDNVSWWKNRSRLNNAAVLISTLRNPYSSAVLLGELRRNSCICLSGPHFSKHFPHTMSFRYSIGMVALHTSSITLKSQWSGESHTLHVLRLIGAIVLESGTSISLTCRMVSPR